MSAPRKIWAAPSTARGWNVAFCSDDTPEDAKDRCEVYHHDDVVRELMAALEEIKSLPCGESGFCRPIADAALAKVAQEG